MSSDVAVLLVVQVLDGLLFAILPRISRPGLFFAVTVPGQFPSSPTGTRILRRFRLGVLLVTLAAMVILFTFAPGRKMTGGIGVLLVFAQSLAMIAMFLRARHATLPHAAAPETIREAPLRTGPSIIPGGTPALVGPLILLAASTLATVLFWSKIPPRIPLHWGLSGPNRWMARTPGSIAAFLLSNAAILALLLFVAFGLARAVGRIASTGNAGRAESRFRRLSVLLLLIVSYLVALQTPIFLFASTASWAPVLMNAIILVILVSVVAGVIALFRMGQGGSKLPKRGHGPVGDRRADRLWKLGLFYFNPDDPALFVEKRFGLGYTINFGNRWAWVLESAIVLLVLGMLVLL